MVILNHPDDFGVVDFFEAYVSGKGTSLIEDQSVCMSVTDDTFMRSRQDPLGHSIDLEPPFVFIFVMLWVLIVHQLGVI